MTKRMTKEERKLYNIFSARKAEYTNSSLKGKRFDSAFRKVYKFYIDNKERIDTRLKEQRKDIFPAKTFMGDVFERMNQEIGSTTNGTKFPTALQASKKEIRSESYLTYQERAKENILGVLRQHKSGDEKNPDSYELFRKFTRHKKIDKKNLKYVGDNTYQYSTKNWNIYIKVENSPETIKVWKEPNK